MMEQITGRNRRLQHEWRTLEERFGKRSDIVVSVASVNPAGMPVRYSVDYHIRSICGVEQDTPVFASHFRMEIVLPPGYPSIDAAPVFRFLVADGDGRPIPHPWHPNIRYFGPMAGRVCLNMNDTYTDLAWGVDRIAQYLRL